MGLTLKKTLSYFLEPMGLIVLIGLIGFYLLIKHRRLAYVFLMTSFTLLIGFSYQPITQRLITPLEDQYSTFTINPEQINQTPIFIHVLGHEYNYDIMQPLSSHLSAISIKRISEGVLIYKKLKQLTQASVHLIFSGGFRHSHQQSMGRMAANFAMALGVSRQNIIIGTHTKDTEDEAKFSSNIAQDGLLILVSSATHLPRAISLFKKQGLNPMPAPTDFYRTKINYFSLPNISNLLASQVAIHEYLGLLWLKIRLDIFK